MTLPRAGRAVHVLRTRAASRRQGFYLPGAVLVAALVLTSAGVVAQPALADTTDDGNLVVDVTDGVEPSPSPTRTPGPPFTPPGPPPVPPRKGTPPKGDVTQATIPDPDAADDALVDEVVVGGALAMSGLTATASPSFAIGNGTLELSFVVRNTSDEAFDSTARFWVVDVLGSRIADIADVQVDGLEPDETRRVLVRIEGVGQHTVYRTYVTLTPPATIAGVPLTPVTRNAAVVVAPLFSMSLVSGIAALSGLAWWVVSPRGLGVRFRRLGA